MGIGVPTPNLCPQVEHEGDRSQEGELWTTHQPAMLTRALAISDAPPHASLVPLLLPAALSQRICKA